MTDTTADVIARMQTRYGMHAASPVTARRKVTDTSSGRANANQTSGYGAANSLSSRRRGGKYPNTYQPRAKDFAGMDAPTTRPAYGSVKPTNGIRVTPASRIHTTGGTPLNVARAAGEDNEYRAYVAAVTNLSRDAGDTVSPMYPVGRSDRGRLAPNPRY